MDLFFKSNINSQSVATVNRGSLVRRHKRGEQSDKKPFNGKSEGFVMSDAVG